MKKPALREKRSKLKEFSDTEWTKSSKSVGEYIFRRLSLDQSDKELSRIRPRHHMSKLIISSKEIDIYVKDYLKMTDRKVEATSQYKVESNKSTSHPNSRQPHYAVLN